MKRSPESHRRAFRLSFFSLSCGRSTTFSFTTSTFNVPPRTPWRLPPQVEQHKARNRERRLQCQAEKRTEGVDPLREHGEQKQRHQRRRQVRRDRLNEHVERRILVVREERDPEEGQNRYGHLEELPCAQLAPLFHGLDLLASLPLTVAVSPASIIFL